VKRLLLDLNIVLDIVLDRAEAASAARLCCRPRAGQGRVHPAHGHDHLLLSFSAPRLRFRSTRDRRNFAHLCGGIG